MLKVLAAVAAILLLTTTADAQPRHGSCDGIHRCRCGSTQTAYFGLPRIFNGHNLWRAIEWIHAFPRTSPHHDAVGYVRRGGPSGHVFRIVSYSGGGTATVADDKGTYERRIAGAIFVDPNGNATFSAKHHRQRYAKALPHDTAKGTF